jgi:Pectate lyase superfamily protein
MSLYTDIARIALDRPKLQNIVNGDATTVITTDGGQVPSMARLLSQMGAGQIKGAWVTATAYVLGDVVTSGSTAYRCILAHTSAAALATDLAASKWIIHYTATSTVDNIATLKASANTYGTVLVLGYYAAGDGGGGLFRWNSADVTADNAGTIIIPNSGGTGRWNRVYEQTSAINVRWFGAKGDNATNDGTSLLAAITFCKASAGKSLYFSNGTYLISTGIDISGLFVRGEGRQGTKIQASSAQFNVVNIGIGPTTLYDITVHGGWDGVTAGQSGDGIHIDVAPAPYPYQITLVNVAVQFAKRNGIDWKRGGYSWGSRLQVNACGLNGIAIYGTGVSDLATTVRIDGQSVFSDCPNGWGISLSEAVNISFDGCILEYTKGIQLLGADNRAISFCNVYQENTSGGQFVTWGVSAGVGLLFSSCYGGGSIEIQNNVFWQDVHIQACASLLIGPFPSGSRMLTFDTGELTTTVAGNVTALTMSIPRGTWQVLICAQLQDASGGAVNALGHNLTTNIADPGTNMATNAAFHANCDSLSLVPVAGANLRTKSAGYISPTATTTYYVRANIGRTAGTVAYRVYVSLLKIS